MYSSNNWIRDFKLHLGRERQQVEDMYFCSISDKTKHCRYELCVVHRLSEATVKRLGSWRCV